MSYVRTGSADDFFATPSLYRDRPDLDPALQASSAASKAQTALAQANAAVAAAQAAQTAAAAQQQAALQAAKQKDSFSTMLPLLAGAGILAVILIKRKR
jgi:hypothetical protein